MLFIGGRKEGEITRSGKGTAANVTVPILIFKPRGSRGEAAQFHTLAECSNVTLSALLSGLHFPTQLNVRVVPMETSLQRERRGPDSEMR
ncbi:hypothetical protein AAFF_G00158860 [Aldrovandia affinis]|uniref:Uncharacterized protein n=1 Tax=Aldrovandia affinis TaxID=143900 RepID=A0AAD7RMZ0_9TELE|nr:hypothetical protein AAFF_G00158860 [Aldrovandia affinis]